MEKEILKEGITRSEKSITHDVVDKLTSDISMEFGIDENTLKNVICSTLEHFGIYKRKNDTDCKCNSCMCEK